jgi:putative ABC transport system permease protein
MALAAIRAHKLRSFLTLLGVIIGVTAVIGMMSVITGLQNELERQMSILQPSVRTAR